MNEIKIGSKVLHNGGRFVVVGIDNDLVRIRANRRGKPLSMDKLPLVPMGELTLDTGTATPAPAIAVG